MSPLLLGGRPPRYENGVMTDSGSLSGIDRLLLTLAARYGPEGQEVALHHLRTFFDLSRRKDEGWASWIQRFYLVFADAQATGLALNVFGQAFLLLYWGRIEPGQLRDCLSQFGGKLPKHEEQLQALMAHLKR